jgi:hypothetical protein
VRSNGHSVLAPSAASRWAVCTASVGYVEHLIATGQIPAEEESSVYADEGTEAHAYAAAWLTHQREPQWPSDDHGLKTYGRKGVYVEMRKHLLAYVTLVNSLIEPGCDVQIEQKVVLFYAPEDTGTVDVRIINFKRKSVHIIDLKYGVGVGVYAKKNKQLSIYAESAMRDGRVIPDDWIVTLIIFQPRDRSDENAVRLAAVTRAELREFATAIDLVVEDIKAGRVVYKADPQSSCRWCRAKGLCDTYKAHGLSALPDESRALTVNKFPYVPAPKELTREQRLRVIAGRRDLESWLEAVEDYEVGQLLGGAAPITFKLVAGKSNRQWTDERKVEQMLREYLKKEEIIPPAVPEMISVAAAEGLIGKKEFSSLARFITKPAGKPTLVPIEDPRAPLNLGPARDFQNLDELEASAAKPGSQFI